MTVSRHTEAAFETVIEDHLLEHGHMRVAREGFDQERAMPGPRAGRSRDRRLRG